VTLHILTCLKGNRYNGQLFISHKKGAPIKNKNQAWGSLKRLSVSAGYPNRRRSVKN